MCFGCFCTKKGAFLVRTSFEQTLVRGTKLAKEGATFTSLSHIVQLSTTVTTLKNYLLTDTVSVLQGKDSSPV